MHVTQGRAVFSCAFLVVRSPHENEMSQPTVRNFIRDTRGKGIVIIRSVSKPGQKHVWEREGSARILTI